MALVLAGYLVTWYLPHRQELSHANSFYLWHQLVPHTVRRLAVNLLNGAFGDDRGMAPFLMRHSPAQTMLVVAWFLALGHYRDVRTAFLQRQDRMQGCAVLFMVCWLLLSVLFLCFVSYSPSRYYVLFTPALALIAALAAAHVNQLGRTLLESRWALPFLGGYCAYHLALSVMHHSSLYRMLMVGASALAGVLVMCIVRARLTRRKVDPSSWNLALPTAAFTLWAAVNGCYMIDWLSTLSYNQRDAGRWLSANLPSDTILLGDVAPGLCMDNRFHVVNVIAGLCNDRGPVAMYSGHRRAIVILDGAMIESGWVKFYPDLITRERRIKLFPHIGRFPVGVYLVDERDL